MVAPRKSPYPIRRKRNDAGAQMFTPAMQQASSTPATPAEMFAGPLQALSDRGTDFVPGASAGTPRTFDWASLAQGLGAGLLTGKNWGEGVGQGLMYARQFGEQNEEKALRAEERGLRKQKLEYDIAKDQRSEEHIAAQTEAYNAAVDALNVPPETKALLKSQGPGWAGYGDLFPGAPEPQKGVEIAGRLVDPITGQVIADFSDEEIALKRAGVQPPQPTETERLMRAAGIDPSSPEGRALIQQKLAGSGGIQITGYDEQGRPIISVGGPAAKPLTEGQSTGTLQFSLAQQANDALGNFDTTLTSVPDYIASQFGTAGNFMKSPEYQKAEQSATVMAEQYLRALTGAAAPDAEVARTARSIMPLPGDSADVIAQKRATREMIIEALRIKAGPGASQVTKPKPAEPPAGPDERGGSQPTVIDGYTIRPK